MSRRSLRLSQLWRDNDVKMPGETARHRERREARFAVRRGTAARRRMAPHEQLRLVKAVDKRNLSCFGVRPLARIELNAVLPPVENRGVAWLPNPTLLDYASWHGRDHIVGALVRGGADPYPAAKGACRAALETLPLEGLVWLMRAVVRLRFASSSAAAACCRCDGCGSDGHRTADCALWPCGHRRCTACLWSGVAAGDPDTLMLRCVRCSRRDSASTTVEAALTELQTVAEISSGGGTGGGAQTTVHRFFLSCPVDTHLRACWLTRCHVGCCLHLPITERGQQRRLGG